MRKVLLLIIGVFFLLTAACNPDVQNNTANKKTQKTERKYDISLDYQFKDPGVIDTFQVWKQFFRYWDLPPQISGDELRDRVELIQNALTRMQRSPMPPKLDTVDIKSRLALVDNETRQLHWVLDNHWDDPRADSILHRWLESYTNLVHQINFFAGESEDFEEVFREKQKRDELLRRKFGDTLSPTKNQKQ